MTTQELKAYVKDVCELHKQLYTYQSIKDEYVEKIDYYDHFNEISNVHINEPDEEWLRRPEYQEVLNNLKKDKRDTTISAYRGAIIKIIIFAVIVIVLFKINILLGFFGGAIVVGGALGTVFESFEFDRLRRMDDIKAQALHDYYVKCFQEEMDAEKEAYVPLVNHLMAECNNEVFPKLEEASNLLNKLYSMDIIHPKYRNFVAVAQFLEYLDTGRCTELEGPNGAYNLYEAELRANIIIDKLDDIAMQLSVYNQNMSTLISAITHTNHLLDDMKGCLNEIKDNTALTAYNSQVTAFNVELMRRYN